jgi:hypothetical protein
MRPFKDNAGRTWIITVHSTAVKKLRGALGFDVHSLLDEKLENLAKFLGDPVLRVDVLYWLCKEEADKLGITDEDFGKAMWGDAIEHATDAFIAEVVDFTPDARVRESIRKILEASRTVRDRLMDRATQVLDHLDLDSIVKDLTASSGNSLEPSESTQDPSRSAN